VQTLHLAWWSPRLGRAQLHRPGVSSTGCFTAGRDPAELRPVSASAWVDGRPAPRSFRCRSARGHEPTWSRSAARLLWCSSVTAVVVRPDTVNAVRAHCRGGRSGLWATATLSCVVVRPRVWVGSARQAGCVETCRPPWWSANQPARVECAWPAWLVKSRTSFVVSVPTARRSSAEPAWWRACQPACGVRLPTRGRVRPETCPVCVAWSASTHRASRLVGGHEPFLCAGPHSLGLRSSSSPDLVVDTVVSPRSVVTAPADLRRV